MEFWTPWYIEPPLYGKDSPHGILNTPLISNQEIDRGFTKIVKYYNVKCPLQERSLFS